MTVQNSRTKTVNLLFVLYTSFLTMNK